MADLLLRYYKISMSITVRNATTTNLIGTGYNGALPDIRNVNRYFNKFDLTTYTGGSQNINGPTADGSILYSYDINYDPFDPAVPSGG